ncbi:MAG: hypothetical protein CMP89_01410 [Gammaproteobacteria bacterium]|nr:hypothetical protein [Gammaproteobacteria bacterium]
MILTDIDDIRHTGVIVLRPNNSWSWRANVLFLTAFMVLSLIISTGFLMAGAWVVLPFSLLEIIVVGSCIYYSVNQCSRQEVITVTDHEVKIEAGVRKPNNNQTFQRAWAKFLVQKAQRPSEGPVLSIRSHGKTTEIGSFLNRRDKEDLVSQLRRIVPR